MLLFFTSFMAGVLTVLAPCVLPILPIIVGGSVGSKRLRPVLVLIGSLAFSVVLFTLLLRATTALISIPPSFWTTVSGAILIFFGLITLFPSLWEKTSSKANAGSKNALSKSAQRTGWTRELFMGFALGPVFTSCSPTYSLIIATVLPASFAKGVLYTIVYALGLASVLLLVALLGQRLTKHLRGAANPHGWFKKSLGVIFLVVGLSIIFGWDKAIEAFIIQQGYFGVTGFEEGLVEQLR
jgi:cytochrome c biogenesis protein CcdA